MCILRMAAAWAKRFRRLYLLNAISPLPILTVNSYFNIEQHSSASQFQVFMPGQVAHMLSAFHILTLHPHFLQSFLRSSISCSLRVTVSATRISAFYRHPFFTVNMAKKILENRSDAMMNFMDIFEPAAIDKKLNNF